MRNIHTTNNGHTSNSEKRNTYYVLLLCEQNTRRTDGPTNRRPTRILHAPKSHRPPLLAKTEQITCNTFDTSAKPLVGVVVASGDTTRRAPHADPARFPLLRASDHRPRVLPRRAPQSAVRVTRAHDVRGQGYRRDRVLQGPGD